MATSPTLVFVTALLALATSGNETSSGRNGLPSLVRPAASSAAGGAVRTVDPFGPWTRVCEWRTTERTCNLSQQIVDGRGQPVFSLTLAPRKDGVPLLVLRSIDEVRGPRSASIAVGRMAAVRTELGVCQDKVCVGVTRLTPALEQGLGAGAVAEIEVTIENRTTRFKAPLVGLREALASMI